ncbi:MAG: hypothetical protein JOZ38_00220 [Candidatus Eremiobacteraeota bacterium]|nr:hypothetical protein [Candidatus Eremiobacteraeota bacterium]
MAWWLLGIAVVAASVYISTVYWRRLTQQREETHRVRAMFSRYVPEAVVDDLLERKDPRLFEGREYYATILSCRIWQFGLFTEDLDPVQTIRYLNEFYTLTGGAVQKHRGLVATIRDDGITAAFGVLMEDPFQEERALRAALDIVRLVSGMNSRWQSQGRKPFRVGIGVHSGSLVAGDVGLPTRREFALVGNVVQIAQRLQEHTEEMNAAIIASSETYSPVSEFFNGVPIKAVPLRGLKRLANAYIVRGLARDQRESELFLPPEQSFRQTQIRREPPAEPAEVVYPEPPPATQREYVAPQVTTAPQPPPTAASILPEMPPVQNPLGRRERTLFSQLDSDTPAMPEPPPVEATYEDDEGPPFQLPP